MKRKGVKMNECEDWFPEGQDSWGNSSFEHHKLTYDEITKANIAFKIKDKENYKAWLQMSENKRPFNFLYIVKAIKEGKLNA